MLGIVVGSVLMIVMTNVFSGYAHLSAGLYGLLLVVVMMAAPGGLVGTFLKLIQNRKARRTPARSTVQERLA
jgi:branched-chain amino acid transport system permease protein